MKAMVIFGIAAQAMINTAGTVPLIVTTGPQLLQHLTPPAPRTTTAPAVTNTPPVDQTADLDVDLIVDPDVVLIADLDVDHQTNRSYAKETFTKHSFCWKSILPKFGSQM